MSRKSKFKIAATIHGARKQDGRPTQQDALAALRKLRDLGTFKEITDPVAWQREIWKDRS